MKLKYSTYRPSKVQKDRRSFLEERLRAMDTPYRKALVEMAKEGRDATDGIAVEEDRVGNNELMKVPISHAVIMQRLSTLFDNPSRAIYKSSNKNKKKLQVVQQMNKEDKRRGKFTAVQQEMQMKAEKEGLTVIRQGWHEEFKTIKGKKVTVGNMFTYQEPVLLERFFWDPTATEIRGEGPNVANDVFDNEPMSILELRRRYGNNPNYKNINAVKPIDGKQSMYAEHVYTPEWEGKKIPNTDPSNECIVWRYYARNYYDPEKKEWEDVQIEMANGIEIRKTKLSVPSIKGRAELPFFKIVSIPTGAFGGISIPALIRHPEKVLQRMITMADAQAELAVNPITFMSSQVMNLLEDAPLYPGSRVEVDAQGRSIEDEVYTLKVPDITPGAQYIIGKMIELIIIITGVDIGALFESPKTKAISTERKREIQQKLLLSSVIYNEAHGFTDMEEMRLFIMLENYPIKRNFLESNESGKEIIVEKYPEIPVEGYSVAIAEGDEEKTTDEKQFVLKSAPKEFSIITINPATIEYNTHLYVEGATEASNEDSMTINKNIEKIGVLANNPWTQETTDPIKAARWIYKTLGLSEEELMKEGYEKSYSGIHGAVKEIQALSTTGIMDIQVRLDEDYDAKEYEKIFRRFVSGPDFKKLSKPAQEAIINRLVFHVKNAMNPYYKETLQEEKAQQAQQKEQEQVANQEQAKALGKAKVQPPNNKSLSENVASKAGKLSTVGRSPAAEQRKSKGTYTK